MKTSAWEQVTQSVAAAPFPVVVLEPDHERAAECLSKLGITANSWLGAVISNSGGLLVDHGWLRVLGSGTEALPGIRAEPTEIGGFTVAHDVLGGQYAWSVNAEGRPTIHYFAPDSLDWEDLGLGYTNWLGAMLTGSIDEFYDTLRWPGWQHEVAAVRPDQGVHTWPPPWSAEGKDLSTVSRKVVPLNELVALHLDARKQ